jgi:DNA (cytosine-5)-methyltransferase 1
MSLQLVSMFDGIAGFPLAFSRAGVRTVAIVEIDKAAAGVAAEHFPDAARFSDVTEVTADDLLAAGFDPVRGILTAGWPCTDLSLAGLRLGLGGARSGLVGEVFRLLAGLRPRWVVLENVPGLLSSVCPCPGSGVCAACSDDPHAVRGGSCGRTIRRGFAVGDGRCMALHGGGMGTVLRRLGECGYGIAYRVLDAQHFGVPQRRRRVVIVGHLGDAAGPAEVLLEPDCGARHPAPRGPARAGTARITGYGTADAGGPVNALTSSMAGAGGGADDNTAAGGHLVAAPTLRTSGRRAGEPAAGGGLVVASVTAKWAKGTGGPSGDETQNLVTHALTGEGFDASEGGTGRGTPIVPVDLAQITSGENRSNPKPGDPSGTLAASRPAIAFGHTNGIDVQASTEVTPTLRAGHNVGGGSDASAAAVRRLTPTECERLQGLPDGWTAVSAGRPQSDSARYRQIGNSIAVPVFTWVARRIVAVAP